MVFQIEHIGVDEHSNILWVGCVATPFVFPVHWFVEVEGLKLVFSKLVKDEFWVVHKPLQMDYFQVVSYVIFDGPFIFINGFV